MATPKPGDIDVQAGQYVIFDPTYGPDTGEFRRMSLKEIQDAGIPLPENFGGFGETPQGKVRSIDPDTGLYVFTDPPPDPNAPPPPKTPE